MNLLQTLENRRTWKVLGNVDDAQKTASIGKDDLDTLIAAAGNAPFHYGCDKGHQKNLTSNVPWRVYKLDAAECNKLLNFLVNQGDATKVPNMLAAAEYLLQVTWLPDINDNVEPGEECEFAGTRRNMEHIAAASAFIQSLLLVADNAGFKTYWSSGGALRNKETFEKLSISSDEMLLGSIFLFPADPKDAEIKSGSMKDKRGNLDDWTVWCEIT